MSKNRTEVEMQIKRDNGVFKKTRDKVEMSPEEARDYLERKWCGETRLDRFVEKLQLVLEVSEERIEALLRDFLEEELEKKEDGER